MSNGKPSVGSPASSPSTSSSAQLYPHPSNQAKIPLGIWMIGLVTLLVTFSSIISFIALPLYLKNTLGVSDLNLGVFEGIVEATAWFTRIFSGLISDFFHKRKLLLLIGYGLSAAARPVFIFNPGILLASMAKVIERICNGLQATPREALVGDLAPPTLKGACFGLRESLGKAGSFLGSVVLMGLIYFCGLHSYTLFFTVAAGAALLAVLILVCFVHDPVGQPLPSTAKKKTSFLKLSYVRDMKSDYWKLIIVAGIYTFSNFSGVFFVLRAQNLLNQDFLIPAVFVVQNLTSSFSAYPVGKLSDRISRKYLLALSFALVIVSDIFFGFTSGLVGMVIAIAFWGMQMSMSQSLMLTMIADTCPSECRGTGFGIFYFVSGIAILATNTLTGFVSDWFGQDKIFLMSGCFALLAIISLLTLLPTVRHKKDA